MTATATRAASDHEGTLDAPVEDVTAPGVFGHSDHKLTGVLFIGTGMTLLLVSLIANLVVGFERLDADSLDLLTYDSDVLQVFALSQMGLVVLGVLPILIGLGVYLVPLQVGAPTLAFPRAAAAAFWMWFLGAGLQLASFGINGGPWGGESDGVDLWASSTILLLLGLMLATACVVTTVVAHRAPGMTLDRTPLLSWSLLAAGSIWLATIPVLLGDLLLVLVDHSNGQLAFGVNDAIWSQAAWILLAPAVLMLVVPVLGIAADIIPVHAGTRQRFHRGMLAGIAGFAFFTFGAWSRPLLASEPVDESVLYQGMAMLIALPMLLLIGGWIDTFRRGDLRLSGPVIASLLGVLVVGALIDVGIAIAIPQTELAGTTAINGVAGAAVLGAVLGIIAALGHWGPKLLGVAIPEGVLKIGSLLVAVGAFALLGGEVVAGLYDQGPLPVGGDLRDTAEAMAPVIFAGWLTATVGIVVVGFGLLVAVLSNDDEVGDDPWGGHTLEWATSSPPPAGNFAKVPMVTSATPLLDDRAPEKDAS